ncbi:unnamed protein product [Microthlaspi erraticum]|uniref:F-box domain-containing protein n=1 Tax=Microthlaspi erraticum TaxID=1685480 RepID=A0A6D2HHM5_9BRAS|nr:unnamed protein product [Microthlaspi erraticum]
MNTVDVPEDLVVEILSRVPEVSVARFRSIPKGWNALIKKEERLAKKSLILILLDFRVYLASIDLRDNVVKLTSQFSLKDPLCNPSKEVDLCDDVFHCDGLLLCTTEDKRLVVWNPRSGETSWVKPIISHEQMGIYALGKSSCNKYKILRINTSTYYMPTDLVEYEVYDFNSNSWRVIVGECRDWYILLPWHWGMSVSGNTYLLAGDVKVGEFLLSFDFSTERFGRVSLPPGNDDVSYHVWGLSVTREEQQLCLLTAQNKEVLDLWRATKIESSGAGSWCKFLSLDLAYLHHPLDLEVGMNFLADRENRVLVFAGKHGKPSNFLHIVGEDKYIQVDHHDVPSHCSLLLNYVPTLVKIQQGNLGVGARKAPIT